MATSAQANVPVRTHSWRARFFPKLEQQASQLVTELTAALAPVKDQLGGKGALVSQAPQQEGMKNIPNVDAIKPVAKEVRELHESVNVALLDLNQKLSTLKTTPSQSPTFGNAVREARKAFKEYRALLARLEAALRKPAFRTLIVECFGSVKNYNAFKAEFTQLHRAANEKDIEWVDINKINQNECQLVDSRSNLPAIKRKFNLKQLERALATYEAQGLVEVNRNYSDRHILRFKNTEVAKRFIEEFNSALEVEQKQQDEENSRLSLTGQASNMPAAAPAASGAPSAASLAAADPDDIDDEIKSQTLSL